MDKNGFLMDLIRLVVLIALPLALALWTRRSSGDAPVLTDEFPPANQELRE